MIVSPTVHQININKQSHREIMCCELQQTGKLWNAFSGLFEWNTLEKNTAYSFSGLSQQNLINCGFSNMLFDKPKQCNNVAMSVYYNTAKGCNENYHRCDFKY